MKILNKELKRRIIEISYKNKQAHIGSCLTALDIIKEIYDKKKPEEKFVLSSGHAGLALYTVIEGAGGVSAEEIFAHHGVHPDRCTTCGLYVSTGSLGHGIGVAVGMALADRTKNVYCLISDGECSEGSVQEALRIKNEQKLDNLKIYVNFNTWGAYKKISHIDLPLEGIEKINVRRTGYATVPFPFLQSPTGQQAHYAILDEKQYNFAMEVLA